MKAGLTVQRVLCTSSQLAWTCRDSCARLLSKVDRAQGLLCQIPSETHEPRWEPMKHKVAQVNIWIEIAGEPLNIVKLWAQESILNLTITEISFTKTRRANRNAQGSQRSWAQGSEQNKTNNQSANNQSINQSIDPLINQSINPINQSIDESISIQVNGTRNKSYQQTFVSKTIGKTKQNNKRSYRQQLNNLQKEGQQQS